MLEEIGKTHWLIIEGNRRDKFIKWLTKICPEYKIWHFSKNYLCKNGRYGKYYDKNRYSDKKLFTVMKNSFPVYIEFKISNDLATLIYFSIIKEKHKSYREVLIEFFKKYFDANTALFPRASNITQKNLIIFVDRDIRYLDITKNLILIENTMR